jgi:ATP-binding cassette subfamily B protein
MDRHRESRAPGTRALQWGAAISLIGAMSVYLRTLSYYRPFLTTTSIAVALTIAGTFLNLLKPWPFKFIVDSVLPWAGKQAGLPALAGYDLSQLSPATVLLILCGLIVLIHFAAGVLGLVTNLLFVRVGLQSLLKLRTDLYAYLQSLPLKFHDARRSSDSSFRVAYDSQAIQTIYNRGFTNIFSSSLMVVSTFAIMWQVDPQLTLVSLGVMPLVVLAIRHYADRVRKESTTIQERESAVLTVAQEGLSSIKIVHAFGREDWEVGQFHKEARGSMEAHMRSTWTSMESALVVGTFMALGTAAMYFVGSLHVVDGTLQLGELLVFASYLVMLYQPLESLTYTAWALEGAAASVQRCFEVLDRENDVREASDAKDLPAVTGKVEFDHISFSYGEGRPVLRDISVEVPAGETVAFVGGTGAGKSTLLSMVPRFYDPDRGAVRIDGHDVREVTKKSLREQISIVLQDTLLFSTTIRENIAYGRPDATDEEIMDAARRAQAHEFIVQMENGYENQVGERGGHLSVGQRQRIGIARAFLKNAPILLLDEPTSALDPATEAAIMSTIAELMKGRTTLIITHRIATIHSMEKIVVLRHGEVVEVGRGLELVGRGGVYAELYRSGNYGVIE